MEESSVFINSISWNCIQYMVLVFLCASECFKQDSNSILKQFLHFLTINFWEKKVDVNYNSLNEINIVFLCTVWIFCLISRKLHH